MTKEEKQLLLKVLCEMLPYGVICKGIHHDLDVSKDEYVDFEVGGPLTNIGYNYATLGIMHKCELDTIKPYLRPMSSMTKEEKEQIRDLWIDADTDTHAIRLIDFYNKHHLDYRGLIPMGLALEAPEGMYNVK